MLGVFLLHIVLLFMVSIPYLMLVQSWLFWKKNIRNFFIHTGIAFLSGYLLYMAYMADQLIDKSLTFFVRFPLVGGVIFFTTGLIIWLILFFAARKKN